MTGRPKDPEPVPASVGGKPSFKLALLTNIVAPYRVPIYNALAKRFSLHLLLSGSEGNRKEWEGTERLLRGVRVKHSAGFTYEYFAPRSGQASDNRYLHVTPGYMLDLIKLRPDAVISVELGFRTLCAQAYCALARVPLWIWWEGSIESERDIGGFRKALRRLIVRHAKHWISAGLNATEYLRTLGVAASRVVSAQNCVDEAQFRNASPPAKFLGPRPVLLLVGRLVPGKGVGLLLDVAAELRAEGRTFSVIIVGDGVERMELQRKTQALGLDNVEFHLARSPEELPAYYRGADLLVFPTLHDVWGLVVSEALWSGLPVLASKYAGCATELLPVEQIFDPLDPKDFTTKLRRAIEVGLPPADTSRLMPVQRVADAIGDDIEQLLRREADPSGRGRPLKQKVQVLVRGAHVRLFDRGLPSQVAVYMHSIEAGSYARFEELVVYFRDLGYAFSDPEDFVSETAAAKRIFVSFDDNFQAWRDALSLFDRLRLKVTFYVNTLPLGHNALGSEIIEYYQRICQPADTKPLTRGGVRDLATQGHTIGSHTYSHQKLSTLPLALAIEEIRRGRTELEEIIGQPVLHFSYPFGMTRHFSQGLRDYCRDSGLRTVATAVPGLLHSRQRPLGINRTGWDLERPLGHNLENLRVDGRWFEKLTGRSAVGNVFPSTGGR